MKTEESKPNCCRNTVKMWNLAQLNWSTRSLLERSAINGDSPVEEDQKVDSGKEYCSSGMEQEDG